MGSEGIHQIKNEAVLLDQAFAKWQEAQAGNLKPWTIGHVSQRQAVSKLEVGYWPGKLDMYFDLYLAAVWNTSRTARILLINLIVKLSKILNPDDTYSRQHQDTLHLVEDIISSIPFHLAEDLPVFLRETERENTAPVMKAGRPVGGLLLIHSIYVASKLPIVPLQMQEYMNDTLEWIATYMGIGQASLFAKVSLRPSSGVRVQKSHSLVRLSES